MVMIVLECYVCNVSSSFFKFSPWKDQEYEHRNRIKRIAER